MPEWFQCEGITAVLDRIESLGASAIVTSPYLLERVAAGEGAREPPPDGEAGKSGCPPQAIDALARAIAAQPRLRLRGLMAIPEPTPDLDRRRATFRQMRAWFDALKANYPDVDTLSMGMSEDYLLAVEEGATMVRIGSALFGARS